MLALVSAEPAGRIRSLDCSFVKVHRDGANPAGGQASQAMGMTKGGLNSKIVAVVDGVGRAVALALVAGPVGDVQAAASVRPELLGKIVIADKGFDASALREDLVRSQAITCIPPRRNRKIVYRFSKPLYRHRHTVENFFCRIKIYRRAATRYDKLAAHALAFVTIAAILDWLNHEV